VGSDKVDGEIKEMASAWLETAKDTAEAMVFLERDPCTNPLEYFNEISFEVFKPSDSFAGILFTDLGYNGGAHGYRVYQALNYNLETGGYLELTDLFPDPDKSLTEFFHVIYDDICNLEEPKHQSLPHYYGGVPCQKGEDRPKPPKEFLAKVDSLENLGNLVLTPTGATVNIGPHSAWSWAEGPYILHIPKEKLLLIGGNKALWENGTVKQAARKTDEQSAALRVDPPKAQPIASESTQSPANLMIPEEPQAGQNAENSPIS
jgi:hypothetical protein